MSLDVRPYWQLMRCHQWLKSSFVFVGLIFAHGWQEDGLFIRVCAAAFAFSLAASAVYILNDWVDRENDRLHPSKSLRPLASGRAKGSTALMVAGACLLCALALGYWVSIESLCFVLGYALLNVGYSFGLKHIVILDVFLIAVGFILRLLVGTIGVGLVPSHWLLLCGLTLTLFLGFAKRRSEVIVLQEKSGEHRRVLSEYDPAFLDTLLSICAGAVIVSYGLYTVSPETLSVHGTSALIYSLPFVMYGIFRYLYLLHHQAGGGDPAATLLRDPHMLITLIGWLVTVLVILA